MITSSFNHIPFVTYAFSCVIEDSFHEVNEWMTEHAQSESWIVNKWDTKTTVDLMAEIDVVYIKLRWPDAFVVHYDAAGVPLYEFEFRQDSV